MLLTLGPILIRPSISTEPVSGDPDDIAVWVDHKNPDNSLVIGTDKENALYGFDLMGRIKWVYRDIEHPNNVDIECGALLGNGRKFDIAVVTERGRKRLRIFEIREGGIRDITGRTGTFEGEVGPATECMGIGLYKRHATGETFAFVSRKASGARGYVWQYKLVMSPNGTVDLVKVREVGRNIPTEVEAIVVDDEMGFVYIAEELVGIHKFYADPSKSNGRLSLFANFGYTGDREGLAIWSKGPGQGYLASCDQIPGGSIYNLYGRAGTSQRTLLVRFLGVSDSTDGIDIVSDSLPGFPNGLLIAMNSRGKNFHYYSLPSDLR